jgi:putative spermidine/putrescine transport system permease protein
MNRAGSQPGLVSPWLVLPAVLFLVVFFVLPLLNNATRSLASAAFDGQTYYVKLLTDPYYIKVTALTIVLSLVVALVSLLAGYPIAYFLVRHSGSWANVIIFLLIAPLLTSIIMRTVGWQVLFARRGLVNVLLMDWHWIDRPLSFLNSPTAVVIGLVHVLVPFMVLSIASVLQGINPKLEESARTLGAGRLRTFVLVTLPLSLDGIGTGLVLVFMLANGSFVTLLLLGGGSMQTLPLLIYQQFTTTRDFGFAAAMSNVLLVLAMICLYVQLHLIRRRGLTR